MLKNDEVLNQDGIHEVSEKWPDTVHFDDQTDGWVRAEVEVESKSIGTQYLKVVLPFLPGQLEGWSCHLLRLGSLWEPQDQEGVSGVGFGHFKFEVPIRNLKGEK